MSSHTAKEQRQPRIRKPIRSEHINKESFAQNLPTGTEFWSNLPDDNLNTLCEKIANVETGYLAVDGKNLIPTDGKIISQRKILQDSGAVFVIVLLSTSGEILDIDLSRI